MRELAKHNLFIREYPALFDYLYRYVCYRVVQKQDAEDIVSEVFTEALDNLDVFDPERGNLSQWLTGIARNKIRLHWRLKQPLTFIDEMLEDLSMTEIETDQIDEKLLVEKIMKDLPAEVKALLAMRYIDGLAHDEIAQMIGKTPAAVRQWFSRLHASLRLRYNEDKPQNYA